MTLNFLSHLVPAFPDTPNDTPGQDPFTLHRMFANWCAVIMLPTAVVTYSYTQSVPWTALSFVAWPFVGMVQGMMLLLSFRSRFGKVPKPHTPAHGVVVVHPKDGSAEQQQEDDGHVVSIRHSGLNNQDGCSCAGGCRWRQGQNLSKGDQTILDKALQEEEPLRLLVMGDSLALGVGTHESCTAILPEALAKTLSKQSKGRPVYWTCHGSPGASAGWIVRELQRGLGYMHKSRASVGKPFRNNGTTPGLEYSDSSSEDSSVESTSSTANSSSNKNTTAPLSSSSNGDNNIPEWRRRLTSHRQCFDPDMQGPYDIVVIMTGPNDVKSAVLPFLVHKDEAELRASANSRNGGGGLTSELELVLETLGPKMSTKSKKPLVVFPGMPTALLPIFQQLPIRWMAIPVSGIMDQHKVNLSKKEHDKVNVMYVKPPSVQIASDFEAQRGLYWEQRIKEDTLLALRDVSKQECERKCRAMRAYYEEKTSQYRLPCYPPSQSLTQANVPVPKLSERKQSGHKDGSKIVCIDNVHPNDEGYDMWGRHIAHGILEQMAAAEQKQL